MIGPFQELDGSISMRRILAAIFACAAVFTAVIALPYSANGWVVFIPSGLFVVATIICLFFTTWEAVAGIVKAAKGS